MWFKALIINTVITLQVKRWEILVTTNILAHEKPDPKFQRQLRNFPANVLCFIWLYIISARFNFENSYHYHLFLCCNYYIWFLQINNHLIVIYFKFEKLFEIILRNQVLLDEKYLWIIYWNQHFKQQSQEN